MSTTLIAHRSQYPAEAGEFERTLRAELLQAWDVNLSTDTAADKHLPLSSTPATAPTGIAPALS
ncbi:hypothetical protein VB777_01675 [Synechococcus sp. CCY9202]|uniref:hypothetical protein n=1 Tax=Synechococcus sp. CCY9201 TaxID=174697 RepID=UPI002B1EC274|nr:hypothetical protein [Synechococcus sp. CCY9201]MEA5421904.1 hypothetical protein [Synechococcus sp. CCY9202]